jgi:hypothetical protein
MRLQPLRLERTTNMKSYEVRIVMRNTFEVEAENELEAELVVRNLGINETIENAEILIEEVNEQ